MVRRVGLHGADHRWHRLDDPVRAALQVPGLASKDRAPIPGRSPLKSAPVVDQHSNERFARHVTAVLLQRLHAFVDAAPNLLVRQLREPPLDQVQPGRPGGREAGIGHQPGLMPGVLWVAGSYVTRPPGRSASPGSPASYATGPSPDPGPGHVVLGRLLLVLSLRARRLDLSEARPCCRFPGGALARGPGAALVASRLWALTGRDAGGQMPQSPSREGQSLSGSSTAAARVVARRHRLGVGSQAGGPGRMSAPAVGWAAAVVPSRRSRR